MCIFTLYHVVKVRKICNDGRERRRDRWISGKEGGRRVTAMGGVVDCFSYKSGLADRSPFQTTVYSGLCVSVTGAKEGGRAFHNSSPAPVIFFCLHYLLSCCDSISHSRTFSVSLNIFASIWVWVWLISDGLRKYGQHQFEAHWGTSAQLELNCPNRHLEELSPVIFSKVSVFITIFPPLFVTCFIFEKYFYL